MTILILQARLDSTRLPGKSLLPLGGRPLLFRTMEALKNIPCTIRVLACPEDCENVFSPLAEEAGFELVTGPKEDVLARFCIALRKYSTPLPGAAQDAANPPFQSAGDGGDVYLIRATADNPFVFTAAAASLHEAAVSRRAAYASWTELPYGAGTESVSAKALFRAEKEARAGYEREHVCPYLYNHPELFRLYRSPAPAPFHDPLPPPGMRLTVDTEEDYGRAEKLYAALTEDCGMDKSRYEGARIIPAYRRIFP